MLSRNTAGKEIHLDYWTGGKRSARRTFRMDVARQKLYLRCVKNFAT